MKLAIMQPYFVPYIGYFQLINYVDKFVVYDDIQYTKKGWINRNRILLNQKEALLTLPLKKDSDFLVVKERFLSPDFDAAKMLRLIKEAYRKAPFFEPVYELLVQILTFKESNLFTYLHHSITRICAYLGIETEIIISSSVHYDRNLKASEKVIDICRELKAQKYINPIGGTSLYHFEDFEKQGIELLFLKSNEFRYNQLAQDFIPWLSIVDIMMMNDKKEIKKILDNEFHILRSNEKV